MKQADLFLSRQERAEPNIPGLSYISGYLSFSEERILLQNVDQEGWLCDLKRRVQHYGYKYDYKARAVSLESCLGPLPPWISSLCARLQADKIFPEAPDQVIVNEYTSGQGISAHIDCVPCFGGVIASLSLASPCVMEFSNSRLGKREIALEERSLVVLSGPARYEWQHAIPGRKSDVIGSIRVPRQRRVSLTFRKVIL
jgi:alkylated DNA repair dioxygenase AlkB